MRTVITHVLLAILLLACKSPEPESIIIDVDQELSAELAYPLSLLKEELAKRAIGFEISHPESDKAHLKINLKNKTGSEANDGFSLLSKNNSYELSSECSRGLIYGLLEIVKDLRSGKEWRNVQEREIEAHYPFRAIKFNLPWYPYRSGEHLDLHYETCRDTVYWEAFLDMMLENKFNTLTLWNMHPYMFMVQSESFPKASPFNDEEMADWKSFWKQLFKMAKERGIDTYIVNWNIFVSDEFSKEYQTVNYGGASDFFGDGESNELIELYTREMVTQTINEYDDLTGIGLTLGERMGGMTSEERRDWADRVIIAGLKAADRKARLIYRAPLSAGKNSGGSVSVSTEKITREAIENLGFEDDVWISFKFNWSHAHSSPKVSIVHGGMLTDTYWEPLSDKYKGLWTMRNEDFFVMRWAQPDFIRDFIGFNSQDYIGGCIIGSETYIPAKDYFTKKEHRTWKYAFERQWLFYKVWGNLLYQSSTPDSYFEKALADKFSLSDGAPLLEAWKLSSMNANRFASFFRGTWDATIYTEGFTTIGGKFIDINNFIDHPVLDSSYINISDFVRGTYNAESQITPLQLADLMVEESNKALEIIQELREEGVADGLEIELCDIEFWSNYGLYFAAKIRAGVALENYRIGNHQEDQKKAIRILKEGLETWKKMVILAERYNVEVMPYQFDQEFSWRKHIVDAEYDIEIARKNIQEFDKIKLR